MSLEQKLERSEELLEVNEQNKQKAEQARSRLQQAQTQVRMGAARVQQAQNQLQQAIAARNAAAQQSSGENNSPKSLDAYDAAVSRAQTELSAANREFQFARREQLRAGEELERAEAAHRESAEQLSGVVEELRSVSQKYGLEMRKTQALMNTPEGRLASPLFQSLGAGREQVDDLRRRIAASLGLALASDTAGPSEGFSGERGILSSLKNLIEKRGSTGTAAPSPTRDFNRINGDHSIEDDLKNTNPNYSSTDPESVWNINCQRCVSAYEARRRGYDVEALPVPEGRDDLPIMNHPRGWPSVYQNPELIDCSAATGEGGRENVERQMESWGDNCRAIVRVRWLPEYGGGGHVFIAERVNGVTRFVDPQSGETDSGDNFSYAKGSGLFCMRTDNLPFSDRIRQCCKNRGGSV